MEEEGNSGRAATSTSMELFELFTSQDTNNISHRVMQNVLQPQWVQISGEKMQ